MAVPSTIADLDAVASNNSPAGTESIGTSLDDYLRAHAAIIKQVSNAKLDSSSVTAAGLALIDDADAAAQRTTLGLVIGTNVQAYDADIPTVAASQVEMEAGTESALRSMSPLRVAQAISSLAGNQLTSGTAQSTSSGTEKNFTGIPSWVKRITVMADGISTSGASGLLIQIGDSGGPETTGYSSVATYAGSGTGVSTSADGFILIPATAGASTNILYGKVMDICLMDAASNKWVASNSGGFTQGGSTYCLSGGGTKSLSGTLDRIRLTTVNGTDTFDAGSINILYE